LARYIEHILIVITSPSNEVSWIQSSGRNFASFLILRLQTSSGLLPIPFLLN